MGTVLDGLKERLETAKARLAAAQQKFQAAQMELNAANANHNVWNAAVQIETQEEAARFAEAQARQPNLPMSQTEQSDAVHSDEGSVHDEEPINRTELVREQLQMHPEGMTTAALWDALQHHLSSKAYLYSITKRLRDRDEILLRRGKFYLRQRPTEDETNEVVPDGGGLERIPIQVQ